MPIARAKIESAIQHLQDQLGIAYLGYEPIDDADGWHFFFSTPDGQRSKISLSGLDYVKNSERLDDFLQGKIKLALKSAPVS